jgi:hypothetical protein
VAKSSAILEKSNEDLTSLQFEIQKLGVFFIPYSEGLVLVY